MIQSEGNADWVTAAREHLSFSVSSAHHIGEVTLTAAPQSGIRAEKRQRHRQSRVEEMT